jgi:hypothetical protein
VTGRCFKKIGMMKNDMIVVAVDFTSEIKLVKSEKGGWDEKVTSAWGVRKLNFLKMV